MKSLGNDSKISALFFSFQIIRRRGVPNFRIINTQVPNPGLVILKIYAKEYYIIEKNYL